MHDVMIGSIIYFISFSVLLILLSICKKNEKKVNGVSYFVFCFLLVWCYEAVSAGLLNLLQIPINLLSVSLCDIIAIVVVCYLYVKNGKEKQEYYWNYKDLFVIVGITTVTAMIAYSRYDGWFEVYRFKSGDGSVHLMWAEDVVRTEKIGSMYFQKMRDGLNLMFFGPILGTTSYYKIFLAFQTFLFGLSGITFWTLIGGELKSSTKKIIGFIITLVYMLGYPLNNMLYGFTYWGTSILLVTLILFIFKEYKYGNLSFGQLMIASFLTNTALSVCYVYFAPVVFGAQFIYIWIEKKGCWKNKIMYTIFPLFLAGILCIIYVYFGIFTSVITTESAVAKTEEAESTVQNEEVQESLTYEVIASEGIDNEQEEVIVTGTNEWDGSIASGLALPGVSYYDLYSNFVLLIPFILVYLENIFYKRRLDEYILFFVLTIGYIAIQFVLCYLDYISLYYYNKNYNLLWLLCFVIMVRVIANMDKTQNQFVISYGLMCSILLIGSLNHIDERLREHDEYVCLEDRAGAYFNLISTNIDTVRDYYNELRMSDSEQELCNEAAKLTQAGCSVAWAAPEPRFDDFYAITNQIQTTGWNLELEYFLLEERKVDYALVSRDKAYTYCNEEYTDNQNRVFENDYGYIIEVR